MVLYGSRSKSAWALLAWALEREYALSPLPEVAHSAKGKPFFPSLSRIHFNLSHSGGLALCALSPFPVGVDIESIRPRREGLPRYALTQQEYKSYQELGGDWPAFYLLWTRRESWCKYTGEGLATHWGGEIPEDLALSSYEGEDWRAAVCGEEPPPREIIWMEDG